MECGECTRENGTRDRGPCEHCKQSLALQFKDFQASQGLAWGQLSIKGRQWLHDSHTSSLQSSTGLSYSDYTGKTPEPIDDDMIRKDVLSGRSDPGTLPAEFRELIAVGIDQYRGTVVEVLRAYCVRNPQSGYCQGLNYVTVWLLLFMDPGNAFWTLCNLTERILTPGFYQGHRTGNSLNGFYIESTVVAALLDFYLPAIKDHSLPVTDFADCFSLPLLIQLFITSLDFPATVFLWDCLFSEGSIALIRGVMALAYISEQDILSGKHPSTIYKDLQQLPTGLQLPQIYPLIRRQVTDQRVERLRRQARDYRAYQWRSDKDVILRRIQAACKLEMAEIVDLQEEFNALLAAKRANEDQIRFLSTIRKDSVALPLAMQAEINKLDGPIDIGLTRREFSTLLTRYIGPLTLNSNRLFDLFDEDRSGYIDFRELCICFSLLSKGSFEEKLRLCFDLYDLEASGCLRKQELVEVIQAVSLPLYEELEKGYSLSIKQTIDTLYTLLSALADSGLVTWAEFLATIRQNPTLERCFSAYISIQETIKRPIKHEVRTPANLPKATTSCVQCLLA